MVDCPQREQNEWTGDGMLTGEVISMQYGSYGMYYEWMLNFKDSQLADGSLPAIVPCRNNWQYNFAKGLDWSSAIIHIPYYAYKYSGDASIVKDMWENMRRAMRYFETRSENRLMDFGVGDWVSLDPMCPREITDTAYYRIDALMMAELARELDEDAEEWISLAEEIKNDFREKYVKDGRLTERCFTALICAVYSGMLEDSEIQPHVDAAAEITVKNGYAFRCGIHGLRMLFDVFGRYGYNSLVYKVLTNAGKMGYARSVADGTTTLPEQFDYNSSVNPTEVYCSLNHHFTAMVDGWFFRCVAGISHEGFGNGSLVIEPRAISEIKSFRAAACGVTVEKDNGQIKITSEYPFKLALGKHSGSYGAGYYEFSLTEGR
jgi:hypothetical protein